MKISILALVAATAALTTAAQAAAPASLQSGDATITHESMGEEGNATPLDYLFNIYFYEDHVTLSCTDGVCRPEAGEVEPEEALCYTGDVGRICSLLSKMSKLSTSNYTSGDHQMAALKGCRIQGRGAARVVDFKVRMTSDYSDADVVVVQKIQRCE